MDSNIYILLAITSIILFLILFFYLKNKRIKILHFQQIKTLKNSIILHRNQISFRQSSLSKYNFMEYNLRKILVPQPEIELYPIQQKQYEK